MMPCRPSTPLRVMVIASGVERCARHHLQGEYYQKSVDNIGRPENTLTSNLTK